MNLPAWEDGSIGGVVVAIIWLIVEWLKKRSSNQGQQSR
jgi:hypothetical protein